jgi:hypothetical protein
MSPIGWGEGQTKAHMLRLCPKVGEKETEKEMEMEMETERSRSRGKFQLLLLASLIEAFPASVDGVVKLLPVVKTQLSDKQDQDRLDAICAGSCFIHSFVCNVQVLGVYKGRTT